ncbi:MAG TPA: DUF6515 family protein [Puia sp.]|nr:DUF6515 family protein [Puia sp.]
MQTPFKYSLILLTATIALIMTGPQQGIAQRFNHGGGGGGGRPAAPAYHPAPVSRPAPAVRQAPAPSRPVESRPVENRPVEEHPTINGGSRNFGNHDYSRPVTVHNTVNVRNNVTVRDNVNAYHTGGYRGIHPYYYHPYRPYAWGPHWHPVGFFLSALAADAIWFNFNNTRYWYDDGCFYLPQNGGYDVVPAPIGAIVAALPPGYETTVAADGVTYYYFAGVFYVLTGQGYQVVAAPPGAVIYQLPDGAVDQQVDGQDFLVYNNTWYEPISQDGQDAYEVVPPPGQ